MPNTPAAVGVGASVVCGGKYSTQGDVELAEKLLSAVGTCRSAPESSFDAITALSGSGPAYVKIKINI